MVLSFSRRVSSKIAMGRNSTLKMLESAFLFRNDRCSHTWPKPSKKRERYLEKTLLRCPKRSRNVEKERKREERRDLGETKVKKHVLIEGKEKSEDFKAHACLNPDKCKVCQTENQRCTPVVNNRLISEVEQDFSEGKTSRCPKRNEKRLSNSDGQFVRNNHWICESTEKQTTIPQCRQTDSKVVPDGRQTSFDASVSKDRTSFDSAWRQDGTSDVQRIGHDHPYCVSPQSVLNGHCDLQELLGTVDIDVPFLNAAFSSHDDLLANLAEDCTDPPHQTFPDIPPIHVTVPTKSCSCPLHTPTLPLPFSAPPIFTCAGSSQPSLSTCCFSTASRSIHGGLKSSSFNQQTSCGRTNCGLAEFDGSLPVLEKYCLPQQSPDVTLTLPLSRSSSRDAVLIQELGDLLGDDFISVESRDGACGQRVGVERCLSAELCPASRSWDCPLSAGDAASASWLCSSTSTSSLSSPISSTSSSLSSSSMSSAWSGNPTWLEVVPESCRHMFRTPPSSPARHTTFTSSRKRSLEREEEDASKHPRLEVTPLPSPSLLFPVSSNEKCDQPTPTSCVSDTPEDLPSPQTLSEDVCVEPERKGDLTWRSKSSVSSNSEGDALLWRCG